MAISATVITNDTIQVTKFTTDYSGLNLEDLQNVDRTLLSDGAIVSYNMTRQMWEANPIINNVNTIIDGGHF